MSFRTLVIASRSKLEMKLGYLVVRGEVDCRVHLSEISTLIVESTSVCITTALICELIKRKIKILFCDEKHNPHSEILPIYGNHDSTKCIMSQIAWKEEIKVNMWKNIIKWKIKNQATLLHNIGEPEKSKDVLVYIDEVQDNDSTNREGFAAKIYFNTILNDGRSGSDWKNAALNYGYAILLSEFNREIVNSGYLTQLGIWHCSENNKYNLSCDLMEPFRYLVDYQVFSSKSDFFSPDLKLSILNIVNNEVLCEGKRQLVSQVIKTYIRRVLSELDGDIVGDWMMYYER